MKEPKALKRILPIDIQEMKKEVRVTSHGGLFTIGEMFRSIGLDKIVERCVKTKHRKRGFGDAEIVESFVTLFTAGGECLDDFEVMRRDPILPEVLGHEFPSASCAREWLYEFHSEEKIAAAAKEAEQMGFESFVPEETDLLKGLVRVNREIIAAGQRKEVQKRATLDIDATIEESHKEEAKATYEGVRGYQPTMVEWVEQELIVSDEFRDGNVPAQKDLVRVLEAAVSNLPEGVEEILVRSDSAAYNHEVMGYCREHGYKFAISADMTQELLSEIRKLPERAWNHWKDEGDAVKQWAEVPYVPAWPYEGRDAEPDRYVAIRIVKKQGTLFADGTDRRHFAVVTSRREEEISGQALLEWHREKAGTIEQVNDVMKNELAAGVLPCGRFGANAAWFRLNVITYNLLSLMRRHVFPEPLRNARPKRLRFLIFSVGAELVHHARRVILRLCRAYRKLFRWRTIRRNLLSFAPT